MQQFQKNQIPDPNSLVSVSSKEKIISAALLALFLLLCIGGVLIYKNGKVDNLNNNQPDFSIEKADNNNLKIADEKLFGSILNDSQDSDIDADGISLQDEKKYGTDPYNSDTDGDGVSDGDEIYYSQNPLGSGELTEELAGIIDRQKLSLESCEAKTQDKICYQNLALQERSYSLCSKADDPSRCITQVASLKKDMEKCLGMKNSFAQNDCIKEVARLSHDKEKCSYIKDDMRREECYSVLALITKDLNICYEISDSDISSQCLGAMSILFNNVNLCQSVADGMYRDDCLHKLSVLNNNTKYCKLISDEALINHCYISLAINQGNAKICADIKDWEFSTECKQQVSAYKYESNQIDDNSSGLLAGSQNYNKFTNFFSINNLILKAEYLILFFFGVLITAAIYNYALSLLRIGNAYNFEKCLKISFIIGLVKLIFDASAYLPVNFGFLIIFLFLGRLIVSIVLFNYLFTKEFQTGIGKNIIIFLIALVISFVIGLILSFIISLIVGFFIVSNLESSGFNFSF